MAGNERRRKKRKTEVVPVSVVTTESLRLEGRTVDVSSRGLFLTAPEIQLVVDIKGTEYRGRLGRALPAGEDGMMGYSVELEECIETTDAHGSDRVPVEV